ncbi:ABC transporter permease [Vibrio sp. WXL103]|uniref:ABC transporter permease n=1 Tax=Vibrio sp. WXL103 TaxID=3450710 RepID=UPI003EC63CCF
MQDKVLNQRRTTAFNGAKLWQLLLENSALVVLIIMLVVAGLSSDRFYTTTNINNIIAQSVPLGIVSLGMLFVILTGGIDLSVGSVMALCSVITSMVIPEAGVLAALGGGVGVGALCGAFSGLLVSLGKLAPFVATLATMTIARGLSLIWSKGQPIFVESDPFVDFGVGRFMGLPLTAFVLFAVWFAALTCLRKSMFGRLVIAIGSNETAVRYSGVKVDWFKFAVYVISGVACAIAGIISATRTGVGSPILGIAFELDVIAAVVIGGASMTGGRGTTLNTIIGVFILAIIGNLMNLMSIPGYHQQVVKGFIIIGAVLIEGLKRHKAT